MTTASAGLQGGKTLIFLANVRTASNSTVAALQEALGEDAVFHLRSGGSDGPGSFGAFQKAAGDGAHPVYAGHFVFGAHRHVAADAEYVTTIREPVERVLSQVSAIRAASGTGLDVPAWLDRYPEANNGMVKRLCGYGLMPGASHVYDGLNDRLLDGDVDVGESHLEQAIARIDQFFRFVLLFGRHTENLLLLERAYDTGPLFSLHRHFVNTSPRTDREDVPASVIREIEDRNRLDSRLYEICRARFEALIAAQESSFAEAVDTMRLVALVLGGTDRGGLTDERLMGRLYALANLLFGRGEGDRAVAVLQRFSAKRVIGERFCRGVLRLIGEHGSDDAFDREVAGYRARFGEDSFLSEVCGHREGRRAGP